jgi:hypothetical protein
MPVYLTGVIGPVIATIQLRRKATVKERDRGLLYTPLTVGIPTTLLALIGTIAR